MTGKGYATQNKTPDGQLGHHLKRYKPHGTR